MNPVRWRRVSIVLGIIATCTFLAILFPHRIATVNKLEADLGWGFLFNPPSQEKLKRAFEKIGTDRRYISRYSLDLGKYVPVYSNRSGYFYYNDWKGTWALILGIWLGGLALGGAWLALPVNESKDTGSTTNRLSPS